jgi:hypothetical protein
LFSIWPVRQAIQQKRCYQRTSLGVFNPLQCTDRFRDLSTSESIKNHAAELGHTIAETTSKLATRHRSSMTRLYGGPINHNLPAPTTMGATDPVAFPAACPLAASVQPACGKKDDPQHNYPFHFTTFHSKMN